LAKYLFVEGNSSVEFVENFERSLFHENQQLLLQAKSGWLKFYILNSEKKQCEAFFPVHVEGVKASSPYKSTFGSILFSNQ
jgi:hypothetical protein